MFAASSIAPILRLGGWSEFNALNASHIGRLKSTTISYDRVCGTLCPPETATLAREGIAARTVLDGVRTSNDVGFLRQLCMDSVNVMPALQRVDKRLLEKER